jgi:hypothetical protein
MSEEFGIRVDPVKADDADGSGQHLTKVGYELAMADNKVGRDDGHRTPFAIASDAAETGETVDIGLLREWVDASHGKHSISWSTGIRQALDLGDDHTDEELATEDTGGETVAEIDQPLWKLLANRRDGARGQLLSAFEIDDGCNGVSAAVNFLRDLGYPAVVDQAGPVPVIGVEHQPPNPSNGETRQC